MAKKERLDVLLVERGFFDSREKAKRAIMAGLVFSGSERLDKPGMKVDRLTAIEVKGLPTRYVSRGGFKLEKAIQDFQLSFADKIVLDIGASTGGFTDCALQHGAKLVYALDVGYNQLDWKLRQDERVVVMERTNFRYVTADEFRYGLPQIATIDVSFISLTLILPVLAMIIEEGGDVVALVKPQFEAGKERVGKKGIVRDRAVHVDVLERIAAFSLECGYDVCHLSYSPITGAEGNIEFLLHLRFRGKGKRGEIEETVSVTTTVDDAHHTLLR